MSKWDKEDWGILLYGVSPVLIPIIVVFVFYY